MIKLGLSIFEEEGAADDDLPPLDEVNDNNDTNAKMEEVDWEHRELWWAWDVLPASCCVLNK